MEKSNSFMAQVYRLSIKKKNWIRFLREEQLNNIVIFVLFLQFLSSFQMYNVIVETNDGPLTNWALIIASYVCSLRTHLSQIVTHPFPLPGPRRGSRRLVGLKLKSVWFCVVATHNNRLKRNSNDFGRIFRKMQQYALWMNAEVKYFLKCSSNKM